MDGRFTNPPFLFNHLPFLLPLPYLPLLPNRRNFPPSCTYPIFLHPFLSLRPSYIRGLLSLVTRMCCYLTRMSFFSLLLLFSSSVSLHQVVLDLHNIE